MIFFWVVFMVLRGPLNCPIMPRDASRLVVFFSSLFGSPQKILKSSAVSDQLTVHIIDPLPPAMGKLFLCADSFRLAIGILPNWHLSNDKEIFQPMEKKFSQKKIEGVSKPKGVGFISNDRCEHGLSSLRRFNLWGYHWPVWTSSWRCRKLVLRYVKH